MNPLDIASHGPVIPVIVIDRVEDALPLAEALLAGGVKVLEVTLRTAAALPAIEAIARHLPEALVGVGTVLNADDARRARLVVDDHGLAQGFLQLLRRSAGHDVGRGVALGVPDVEAGARRVRKHVEQVALRFRDGEIAAEQHRLAIGADALDAEPGLADQRVAPGQFRRRRTGAGARRRCGVSSKWGRRCS